MRCEKNLQKSFRRMNIFNTSIDGLPSQHLESLRKQKSRKEQPINLSEALNATLNFAKTFPNKAEPVRHYTRSSIHKAREITEHSQKNQAVKNKTNNAETMTVDKDDYHVYNNTTDRLTSGTVSKFSRSA